MERLKSYIREHRNKGDALALNDRIRLGSLPGNANDHWHGDDLSLPLGMCRK
jgi:hypothetical protein